MRRSLHSVRFCLIVVVFSSFGVSLFGSVVSWKSLGPQGAAPGSLVEHPADPLVLFMSSPEGGVFKSIDGGQTWASSSRGLPARHYVDSYGDISIGSHNPYPLFVTVHNAMSGLGSKGTDWRSTDGGLNWHPVMVAGDLAKTVADPFDPLRLYSTSVSGHSYHQFAYLRISTDGGETWRAVYSTASDLDRGISVYPSPHQPGLLLMVCGTTSGDDKVLRSSDSGETWMSVRTFSASLSNIAFDRNDPKYAYLGASNGLYISKTAGSLWALSDVKPWNGSASLVDVRPDGSLLLQADGLNKSVDRGLSWAILSPPPEGTRRLIPSRHDSRVLFALTDDSILRTDNESAEWRPIDKGISNYTVTQIVVDGARSGRLYLLANRLNEQQRQVFCSPDYGETWSQVPSPELSLFWNALLRIDPRDSNIMYLVSGTIWVTVSAGATWEEFITGFEPGTEVFDLVVDPLSGRLLAASSTGLYSSETGSGRWAKISDKVFKQLARLDEDTLLALSAYTVQRSSDGGTSWQEVLGGDTEPRRIVGDPHNETVAYILVDARDSSLLKTTDSGLTWQPADFGLSGLGYDFRMNVLSVSGRFLYLGAGGSGVFRSTDGGSSWHPINGSLPGLPLALAIDPNNPQAVYLGTRGNGAFALTSSPGTRLLFPALAELDQTITGIAVANTRAVPADLVFTARSPDGSLLAGSTNPPELRLGAFEQLALTGRELFGLDPESMPAAQGWVQMDTTAEVPGVFLMVGEKDADGALPALQTSRNLYFTRIYQGKAAFKGMDATTRIYLVNPNDHAVHFLATVCGPSGQPLAEAKSYRMEAGGAFQSDIGAIFGTELTVRDAIVRVDVQDPPGLGYPFPQVAEPDAIAGFELVEFAEAKTSIGLSAHTAVALDSAYSAQLSTVPGAMTNLKLVNTTGQSRTVTLEAVDEQGQPLAPPALLTLGPGESIERDVADLFTLGPVPLVGSLIVKPDGSGILGDVLFGEFEHLQRAAALPLEINPARRLVFGQVANGMGYYTGLAVFNPGHEVAEIRLQVFSAKGQETGETSFSLPPSGRLSRLLPDILPQTTGQVRGYMILESDQPIVAQELFGTEDFVAAVPASSSEP